MSSLRRTPLYEEHVAAGGKLVPFAGYEMPIQYPLGITAEHHAVRSAAGLFDVSHMGEFEVVGPEALDLVQFVSTNDASELSIGQAQYSTLTRQDGRLLDDLLVYRLPDRYMLVVNASNRERDYDWIVGHSARFEVSVLDRSDEIALLALQGARAESILAQLTSVELKDLSYYRFAEGAVSQRPALVSRTGYTGEDGFELYLSAEDAVLVWRDLLRVGQASGLVPAGLGARDSLRLEMGYALYGNDLDETRTPFEAGLGWVTSLDKGDFVGRDALAKIKTAGVEERLIGFRLLEKGFPRPGYALTSSGAPVGTVTSGTLSPSLGIGIGMAYVPVALARPGTRLEIEIRQQAVPVEVVRPPFYTAGSIRR